MALRAGLALVALLIACGDDGSVADAGRATSDGGMDSGEADAGTLDASTDAARALDASDADAGAEAGASDAGAPPPDVPGGKAYYGLVYGNVDTMATTWVRHANYTFRAAGTVAATLWQWDSDAEKGKTPYTEHRCTFDGVTRNCATYTPTGWRYPENQSFDWSGTWTFVTGATEVEIAWTNGHTERWTIEEMSSPGLARLRFVRSSFGITHGTGFGSNADFDTFRTLPEIVAAGGLKRWPGEAAGASSNGTTITASDWRPSAPNLTTFHSASWSSAGYTLHAMLPHSPSVCTGACTGSRTGYIMYHLASENTSRQMVYNNWCTCLSLGAEWPCYNRNMHPLALSSIIDDEGQHRGWLFIEQQDQPGSAGYQYQLGYWSDV